MPRRSRRRWAVTVVCAAALLLSAGCGMKIDGVALPVTTATPTGDTPAPSAMPGASGERSPGEAAASLSAEPLESSIFGRAWPVLWRGTASVQVDYYDYCDLSTTERQYVRSATYALPVTFTTEQPFRDGPGATDPNAFRFSFAADQRGVEGSFDTLSSFYGVMQEGSGRDVLLIYWNVRYDRATKTITGTLTDSHRSAGMALNLLFTNKTLDPCSDRFGTVPYTLPLNEGATLTGTVRPDGGTVELSGTTSDRSRDVTVRAKLSRTN